MTGALIMLANAACAAWNISSGFYWLLPFNLVGFVLGVILADES